MQERIGIIGAMAVEIGDLGSRLEKRVEETVGGVLFHTGTLLCRDVALAVSGVGKVNAAMCCQAMILRYRPGLIINTGIAGALVPGIAIGDVVAADAVLQYDMDTSAVGDPVGFVSGVNRIEFPCDPDASAALRKAAQAEGARVHRGIVATGDRFLSTREETAAVRARFDAVANEMEAGSIGQVCFINDVPFAVLRAISDGESDGSAFDYARFAQMAAERSRAIVLRYLRDIAQ